MKLTKKQMKKQSADVSKHEPAVFFALEFLINSNADNLCNPDYAVAAMLFFLP